MYPGQFVTARSGLVARNSIRCGGEYQWSMNFCTFQSRYTETAGILPDDFWDSVHKPQYEANALRMAIERDREEFLEIVEELVAATPANDIVEGSYVNNLHPPREFRAFVAEMWGYVAVEKWLCDCEVADTRTAMGTPDFTCTRQNIDTEVSHLGQDDSAYRIRRELEDLFDEEGYFARTILKSGFNKIADTYELSEKNRGYVEEALSEIESLDPSDPDDIETNAIKIEFIEIDGDSFAWALTWEEAEIILLDPNGQFEHRVYKKAEKQQGDTPLVLFSDCDISFLEVEEIRDLLIGETYGYHRRSDVIISRHVRDREDLWDDYLNEIGALPESEYPGAPCIRPGDEGIFFDDELDHIAGLLVRIEDDTCGYIPNVYTDEVDARDIYETIQGEITGHPPTLTQEDL